jgi:hypothetical protein
LLLSSGSWSFGYDGKDAGGNVLLNGVYLVEVVSQQAGGATTTTKVEITVLGGPGSTVSLVVAPNPAHLQGGSVMIEWQPVTQTADVKVYDLDGGLVRELGTSASPATWDLRTAGHGQAAMGVYFITARIPGQKRPACFKLALVP